MFSSFYNLFHLRLHFRFGKEKYFQVIGILFLKYYLSDKYKRGKLPQEYALPLKRLEKAGIIEISYMQDYSPFWPSYQNPSNAGLSKNTSCWWYHLISP